MRTLAAIITALVVLCSPAWAQAPVVICAQGINHTSSICETVPIGVSTAAENGHVLKSSAGTLVGMQINNYSTSTGLTVMLLDGTAIPANGTLATCTGTPAQTNPCILKWYGVPTAPSSAQPGTIGVNWAPGPFLRFLNGLVVVCSSTGPVMLTLSANCTFSAELL